MPVHQIDGTLDRLEPAEEGALFPRELTAAPRELAGLLEIALMGCDQRARKELQRSDEVVLLADSPYLLGVLSR